MLNLLRPFVATIVLCSILAVVVCPVNIWAQRTTSTSVTSKKRTYFASGEDCDTAIKSGTANFYEPTYLSLHKKLRSGEKLRKLEANQCFLMLTVKGYHWVAQKEGEEVVIFDNQVVRRFDCGNPIRDTYHKTEPEPLPTPTPKPSPTPAPKCPEGTEPGEQPGICIQIIKEPAPDPIDNTCKPGLSSRVLDVHEKKGFDPAAMIRQKLDAKTANRILALMSIPDTTTKVTSLIIYSNGCDYAVWAHSVVKKGLGWWKWIIPIAIAGAFILGYYLRPKCNNCGTKIQPIKSTPSGGGSPAPGRPRRY